MKCPICNNGYLEYSSDNLVCNGECRAVFELEYKGFLSDNLFVPKGQEPRSWLDKWASKIKKW